ncbi:ribosomal protein L6, alpha-beta domain-containing protein [Gorgonomyces haynaldii]|nr:ribosomal protein L6, alpha-beta domain-containing protein [Gorgonomyces haynaldii]
MSFKATALRLSNVGKKMLKYPGQVQITVTKLDPPFKHFTNQVTVKGEKGELQLPLESFVKIDLQQDDGVKKQLSVSVEDPKQKKQRSMWGTARRLIENMVTGVSDGFVLPIKLVGVGYRALMENNQLSLRVGRSHPVLLDIPQNVTVLIPTPQRIILQGIDWQVLTQFAANIRKWRKPEPYNQKGIFVGDETIKKKEGKKR